MNAWSRTRRVLCLLLLATAAWSDSGCLVDTALKHRCDLDSDCLAGRVCVANRCQSPTTSDASSTDRGGDAASDISDAGGQEAAMKSDARAFMDSATDASGRPNTMFVTSARHALNFGPLENADNICNMAASAAGIDGVFRAWLSTSGIDARDRLGDARGWVRPDGAPFADTVDDIAYGRIFYPPNIDEHGKRVQVTDMLSDPVATGTGEYGVLDAGNNCHDWESTQPGTIARAGFADGAAWNWTAGDAADCGFTARFYCFGVDRVATVVPIAVAGKVAFISSKFFLPSTGIEMADALCNDEATHAGLSGTFLALLATSKLAASARFPAAQVWIRPDKVVLSGGDADLFNVGPTATINVTAQGTYLNRWAVFIGARGVQDRASSSMENCGDWTSKGDTYSVLAGVPVSLSKWCQGTFTNCDTPWPIYCLQN